MGFLNSFMTSVGNAAGNKIRETTEKSKMAKSYAESWDDDRLIREFKRESDYIKKVAYGNELKNRGYGNSNE